MSYTNGTCALQLPSSYVLMDEEEMSYVEGGDWKTFVSNMYTIASYWQFLGITSSMVSYAIGKSIGFVMGIFGCKLTALTAIATGGLLAPLALAAAGAIGIYLWNYDLPSI